MKTIKQIKSELNNQLAQISLEKSNKTKANLCKLCNLYITEQIGIVKSEIANVRKTIANLNDELYFFPCYPEESVSMCKKQLQNAHISLNKRNQLLEYLIFSGGKLTRIRLGFVSEKTAILIYRLISWAKVV